MSPNNLFLNGDLIVKKVLVDLQEYVREISKAYGKRDAYRFIVNETVVGKTFLEFEKDINAIASWFVGRGWSGKHIAIIGSSGYNWVSTFLGIACSGNIVIPIDKMLSEDEMLNLLVMGDVDVVFLSKDFEKIGPRIQESENKVEEIINFESELYQNILETSLVELPKIDPDAMTEILFTSGTTGVSKGVMLSQRNIVSNISAIYAMDYAKNLKVKPVVLSVLPIHHTFELTVDNLGVLYCGATVCINDKLENIVTNLNRFQPSVILVVPAIAEVFYKKVMEGVATGPNKRKVAFAKKLNALLMTFEIDARRTIFKSILKKFGGNLTNVIVGGAALRPEIAKAFDEFGVNMYQGYGLTECAPLISANYPGVNKIGSVGRPVSYMDLKIEDGEILVKGPGVMLGYYKNPEATKEAFTEDGWLHTGDLGRQDKNGFLYITGRSKNLIILDNGKNIYPEEIEGLIAVIDGVKDVMVYESKGKICAAILAVNPNDEAQIKAIKQRIKEINGELPPYKRIVSLAFIAKEFPKTTTMKIKRKDAIKMVKELVVKKTVAHVLPTTAEQVKIINAFENVLGCKNIGIKDDFFDLGGDSLAALEAAAIIGVPAQEIYENPTAEMLEKVLISKKNKDNAEKSAIDVNALIKHKANIANEGAPKSVLLTGSTGYLGSHILYELLKRGIKVRCLVRSEEKLKEVLKYYFPKEYKRFSYKVVIGDITQPMLGLSDEYYHRLAQKVDMVIHTAANVSHAGHYEEFELTNVTGTQNVIDFCTFAGATLHHTSTASVHGAGTVEQTAPYARFDEFCLNIGQNYSQNVYIHSKYKAEEKVLIAREAGLKANIFRIGNLTWRSKDGKFQKNVSDNGFLGRCRGLLKLGLFCEEIDQYPIDFTAVDECADAFVRLALNGKANNIYHLYNPDLYSIEKFGKKFLIKVKKVPKIIFDKKLKEKITDKDVAILSFYSSIASSSMNIPMSNEFTVNELKKLGFKWSRVGVRYLRHMQKFR